MKRLTAILSLTLALGSGCAHTNKRKAYETAATVGVIAGLILLMSAGVNCGDCSIGRKDAPDQAHPPQ